MKKLSCFWLLVIVGLFLLAGGCRMRPRPAAVVERPSPTAVPATATLAAPTATPISLTATAVPTLVPTLTPTVRTVEPLHFEHPLNVLPAEEIEAQLAPWLFEPDAANALPLEALANISVEGATELTPAQAKEDVSFLFALLKNGYAGYGYFNEDGRFDQVQTDLNVAIDAAGQEISTSWLLEQLVSHLGFVQDCHFTLDQARLCQQQFFWYVDNLYFYEADGRYFTWQEDAQQRLIIEVNGQSPEAWLKLTLDEQGTPAYLLGQLADSRPDDSLLLFELPDGDIVEQSVSWQRTTFRPTYAAYETYRAGGDIPVVISRAFHTEEAKLTQFVNAAAALANEPLVIVDIRGNGGGNSQWAEQWVTNLTGVTPDWPYVSAGLMTETTVQGKLNWGYEGEYVEVLQAELARLAQEGAAWLGPFVPEFVSLPNEGQLVIVLIDKGIASSGESFVAYLSQLENVLFVGENTGGVTQFGELLHFFLPNSGLPIHFGSRLFLNADLSFSEGVGYLPDVWVPADRAMPIVMEAIQAGWLQPQP